MGAEAMLLGAAVGGATSAMQKKDPLSGALMGALGGAVMPGITNALGIGGGAAAGTAAGTAANAGAQAAAAAQPATYMDAAIDLGALKGAGGSMALDPQAAIDFGALKGAGNAAIPNIESTGLQANAPSMLHPAKDVLNIASVAPDTQIAGPVSTQAADTGPLSGLKNWWGGLSGKEKLLYGGGAGIGAMMLADRMNAPDMPSSKYSGPLSKFSFDPRKYRSSMYAAEGGIVALAAGGSPARRPDGGISSLGSYSDGGRMLRGPGDGMSDSIPGVIGGKRPARLADGEFVVPADVVSGLGNGSTDAGARQLYAMMDKVRKARTGRKSQGREINARKYMPA